MPLTLSREFMLGRMLAADASVDGLFLTGVLSTGIYCLPSCRARKPRPENVVFHLSPAGARAAGLRPCRRCKPDDFYAGFCPDEARLEALQRDFDSLAVRGVPDLARLVGVSSSKLHELFRVHWHVTPAEWLARRRVGLACQELLGTERAVAEIAFQVGFESLSAFGGQFRRLTALTPQAYRNMPRQQGFSLNLPPDYRLPELLRDLSRDPMNPTLQLEGNGFVTAVNLPGGPVVIRVEFTSKLARCSLLDAASVEVVDWAVLHNRVQHLLGLRGDPGRFETLVLAQPHLANLLVGQRGLRIPLYADLFDGLVWAIAGQQVTFAYACTLRRRLIQQCSSPLTGGLFAPLQPEQVAGQSVECLQNLGFTRRRAELLRQVAQLITRGDLNLADLSAGTFTRAQRTLRVIPGIGPWTAQYVLLRVFGAADAVPWGDTALCTALQRFYQLPTRPDRVETERLLQPFSPYRSLAVFHFWQYFHIGTAGRTPTAPNDFTLN